MPINSLAKGEGYSELFRVRHYNLPLAFAFHLHIDGIKHSPWEKAVVIKSPVHVTDAADRNSR